MITPDVINGGFEFLGGAFILNHCRTVIKDKAVAGVSFLSITFFTVWGAWNTIFYTSLNQLVSFYGSIFLSLSNLLYLYLLYKFSSVRMSFFNIAKENNRS